MKEYTLSLNERENDKRYKPVKYVINDDGCWNIISHSRDSDGYGRFQRTYKNKRYQFIHRFVYVFFKEEILDVEVVRHICNNPSCINPKHLEKGTPYDNMQDRLRSGNYIVGEYYDNKTAKLTRNQVLKIDNLLKDGKTLSEISDQLNVSRSCVYSIEIGRTWSQLTGRSKKEITPIKDLHTILNSNNTSGFRGVHYSKTSNKWIARISVNKKRYLLGTFKTKEEAIESRKEAEGRLLNNK